MEAAEAVAMADQHRLQVARVLTLAAESALADIDAALQRLAEAPTELASAAPSRSRGSGWRCCR